MKSILLRAAITVMAVAILAVVAQQVGAHTRHSRPASVAGPAPTGPTQDLASIVGLKGASDPLYPPASGLTPKVSADQAFADAWKAQPPANGQLDSVHGTLAVHGSDDAPLWIITYVGACQPIFGPPGNEASGTFQCGENVRWQVNVDATTGEVTGTFGYDYDGSPDEAALELEG
jgi:hypothetical protein